MIGFTHNNKSYNIKGGESRVRGEAQLQLIGNVRFFVKKEIPLSPRVGCKGISSNYGFLSFNIFRKGKFRDD